MRGSSLKLGDLVVVKGTSTHGGYNGGDPTCRCVKTAGGSTRGNQLTLPRGTVMQFTEHTAGSYGVPVSVLEIISLPEKNRTASGRYHNRKTVKLKEGDFAHYSNHKNLKLYKGDITSTIRGKNMSRADRADKKQKILEAKQVQLQEGKERVTRLNAEVTALTAEVAQLRQFPDDETALASLIMQAIKDPNASEESLAEVLRGYSATSKL